LYSFLAFGTGGRGAATLGMGQWKSRLWRPTIRVLVSQVLCLEQKMQMVYRHLQVLHMRSRAQGNLGCCPMEWLGSPRERVGSQFGQKWSLVGQTPYGLIWVFIVLDQAKGGAMLSA
jgi:hypothetical protein